MTPATNERTAPEAPSGAVLLTPADGGDAVLTERDFWRAVGVSVLATLRSWSR